MLVETFTRKVVGAVLQQYRELRKALWEKVFGYKPAHDKPSLPENVPAT